MPKEALGKALPIAITKFIV